MYNIQLCNFMSKIKHLLSLFLLIAVFSEPFSQCPDARALSYKQKVMDGTNVQSCSQCAYLAAYLCSAKYCATAEEINKLRGLINTVKSNITYMGQPICCPELLNETPQYGINAINKGSSSAGNNGSKSKSEQYDSKKLEEWKKDPNKALKENIDLISNINNVNIDVLSLANSLNGVFKSISSINTIYVDPLDKFRDVISKYRYEWDEETSEGEGVGSIIYEDSNYIFKGNIKKGIANEGKFLMSHYGVFEGSFTPPSVGATPFYGAFYLNFGVTYIFKRDDKNDKTIIKYLFENGDSAIYYLKGIIPMIKYIQKSGRIYSFPENQFAKMSPKLSKSFPYLEQKELRDNYAKLLLARGLKALSKKKIIGMDGFSTLEIGAYNTVFTSLSKLKKMDIDQNLIWHIENLFNDLEIKE